MISEGANKMWENVVTPKVKNDLADFWKKYKKEHGIGRNIVLLALDIDRSLTLELGRVMNLFIDAVLSQRRYEGESALKMGEELGEVQLSKGGEGKDKEDE